MLALDHIVIVDKNIELASEQFSEDFSLRHVKGGQHPNWGTYNYLAFLNNHSYIEWLGVNNHHIAEKSDNPLIIHLQYALANNLPGPFQLALRTNDLQSYLNHFESNNIPFVGPVEGRRTTPNGEKLKWEMLFPTYDVKKMMLPFLIQWETTLSYRPINEKRIKLVNYTGSNIDEFCHIYQIDQMNMDDRSVHLHNCQLQFTKSKNNVLTFTID